MSYITIPRLKAQYVFFMMFSNQRQRIFSLSSLHISHIAYNTDHFIRLIFYYLSVFALISPLGCWAPWLCPPPLEKKQGYLSISTRMDQLCLQTGRETRQDCRQIAYGDKHISWLTAVFTNNTKLNLRKTSLKEMFCIQLQNP